MSKSELKRLCVQNPVGMAEEITKLHAELAQLRQEADATTAKQDARIKELEEMKREGAVEALENVKDQLITLCDRGVGIPTILGELESIRATSKKW